jgi:hypothetical protein
MIMAITTYRTKCWGEEFDVSADWAQASCPVWGCCGMNVADFRHFPERAMRWLLTKTEAEAGGFDPDDLEDDEDVQILHSINVAVESMNEVEDIQEDD